ncbi:MAG: hypothetical protein ABI690_36170 [Chloroflexota bacterium]
MHQAPPTAKGFHFITLEDENGFMNDIHCSSKSVLTLQASDVKYATVDG